MTADTVGGVWTYALELADALAPLGVEVHLATMGRQLDGVQREQLAASAVAALYESSFALEWQDEPWHDLDRAGSWLLELESEMLPDVVHLNGYVHGCLPWRTPVVVVAHSDVLSWWEAVKHRPAPATWERYRAGVQAGLRAAAAVCAPTQAVLDDLRRHYRFGTPSFVVHNGRTAGPYVAGVKERFVLGSGRFDDEAKNGAALRRARRGSAWPVVLIGEGTSLGRRSPEEVQSFVERAAVFASPARYEPFGLAILEAALAGCALVLGDVRSLRELWGSAALYVPPGDDEAIASALRLLQRDDDLRRELGERASRRAERYSAAAMAEGYLSVYERVRAPEPVVGLP
jgi:glycosyltransferase involved in cell wall biosynthesis